MTAERYTEIKPCSPTLQAEVQRFVNFIYDTDPSGRDDNGNRLQELKLSTFQEEPNKIAVVFKIGDQQASVITFTEKGKDEDGLPKIKRKLSILTSECKYYGVVEDQWKKSKVEEKSQTEVSVAVRGLMDNHRSLHTVDYAEAIVKNPGLAAETIFRQTKMPGIVAGGGLIEEVKCQDKDGKTTDAKIIYPDAVIVPVHRQEADYAAIIPWIPQAEWDGIREEAKKKLEAKELENSKGDSRPRLGQNGYVRPALRKRRRR